MAERARQRFLLCAGAASEQSGRVAGAEFRAEGLFRGSVRLSAEEGFGNPDGAGAGKLEADGRCLASVHDAGETETHWGADGAQYRGRRGVCSLAVNISPIHLRASGGK